MLTTIRRGPRAGIDESGEEQVVDLLLACHTRIRGFLALAARLTAARDEPDASITDAAARLARYFSEALPLHAQDEDASITPRLLDKGAGAEIRDALATGTSEHGVLDAQLASLTPIWTVIARDPSTLGAARGELEGSLVPVADLFQIHLAREEQIVFPAVTRLPAAIRAAILREMRARRGQPG
jgi:iron-sulfur cluster repair protein YtfE (RIC family)